MSDTDWYPRAPRCVLGRTEHDWSHRSGVVCVFCGTVKVKVETTWRYLPGQLCGRALPMPSGQLDLPLFDGV